MLVLPHMMDVNVVNFHVEVLLGLDHIHISDILLLGPEQIIPAEVGTRIHIGAEFS